MHSNLFYPTKWQDVLRPVELGKPLEPEIPDPVGEDFLAYAGQIEVGQIPCAIGTGLVARLDEQERVLSGMK